jgi:RND family efflux transporter MFP subunit
MRSLPILSTGPLCLGLLLIACGTPEVPAPEEAAAPAAGAPSAQAPVGAQAPREVVQTTAVRSGEISAPVTATGSVMARRSTVIGPAVPGRILHIFVDVGDQVGMGAPLFQIDPGPYAIALREAEAGRELARAQAADARSEAERTRKLASKDIVASQKVEASITAAAVAEARVEQADARVASVRHDLQRLLVVAPYDGSVVERRAHEGTMATVTPNTHVITLQETGALEATLDVPEANPVPARVGDRARVWVEGIGEPFESRIRAVSDRIDPSSRTYEVRVPVSDPERRIKAGTFARAEIEPTPRTGAVLVEAAAVARQEGGAFAFRISGGVAQRVPLRIGVVGRHDVEVLAGLAPGDEVAVGDAVSRLSDGARVQTVSLTAAHEPAPAAPVGAGEEAGPGARP